MSSIVEHIENRRLHSAIRVVDIDAGIVNGVLLPENPRQNDLPYKFYGISESGRQFLKSISSSGHKTRFERSTTE
jgi:hypothetical protein